VIAAALAAGRRPLRRLLVREGRQRDETSPLVDRAAELGVPVVPMDAAGLAELAGAGEPGVQGMVLEAGPLPVLADVEALLQAMPAAGGGRRLVALDGVEDPRNLGAIARVAEAAGATGLLMTERRSPPLGPVASRASAGALEWLPVCRVPNLVRALERLKKRGLWVVGADPDAVQTLFEIPDRLLAGDLVVLLGAEGRGLRPSVREAVDHPVRIPMRGRVESLNVASAAAVLLFEMVRRDEAGRARTGETAGEGASPGAG
jgi:23S rRNA (guanosine2251-2'-O)-methyltransferase